ncbi:MAG: hypothetical protein RSB41_02815 [Bacilli bacterium]
MKEKTRPIIYGSLAIILLVIAGTGITFNIINISHEKKYLEHIKDEFNTHLAVKEYQSHNVLFNSRVKGDKLIISTSTKKDAYVYKMKDNILECTYTSTDKSGKIISYILLDSISSYKGNPQRSLTVLNGMNLDDYNLKYGISTKEKNYKKTVKINTSVAYSYAFENEIIKTVDIVKTSLKPEGYLINKDHISALIVGENNFIISLKVTNEYKKELYSSIVNIIDALYDKEKKEKFSYIYPDIKNTTIEDKGIKIEYTKVLNDKEKEFMKDALEVIRITIDDKTF